MTTTDQQRRAIAFLTRTYRDTCGGPKLDEPGILVALNKVRHLDAGMVTMAAIRCAADPSIKTPAMIGDPSSAVYVERVGPERARRHTRPEESCRHCGQELTDSCCDFPTRRPVTTDTTTHAAATRVLLHTEESEAS